MTVLCKVTESFHTNGANSSSDFPFLWNLKNLKEMVSENF